LKIYLALTLTGICGVGVASADVLTNVTCQVGTNPPVSNTSNCSINATNSQPSARASIAVNQVTAIPGGGLSAPLVVNLSGLAAATPLSNIGSGPNVGSRATANASVTDQISTLGPVRQGVLTYFGSFSNWQVGPADDSAQFSVSLGSLSGSCAGVQPFCSGPLLGSPVPRSVPFTLGNRFSFNFSEIFTASGDPFVQGPGFASGTASFGFQFFEADGTTPVALYAAPEPGTLGLLLISFVGLGIVVIRAHRVRAGHGS
jgi:hypothetical protein